MSRSRSGSRPPSRPASRPVSMISSALALSPLTMELGEQLITKITSFEEGEENFDICRAFMVSNLLYHSCLDPHERDLEKRFDGIRSVIEETAMSNNIGKHKDIQAVPDYGWCRQLTLFSFSRTKYPSIFSFRPLFPHYNFISNLCMYPFSFKALGIFPICCIVIFCLYC